ncbi:cytochrome c biogenesis protein CcsA [Dysgonomonas macrotermitis]|uniref:ResB-like family protein n=1 Tax=Dysgonomonas macrotermitis TaxID=1346286 RepID=A0A1M4W8D6_9BACT|nr:cytochrome c biogenesis protein CcsA [Dysgonomonas macrotermitis]SHE77524.1 ResB-like family protein [Dysgonomonas macrotermitis]
MKIYIKRIAFGLLVIILIVLASATVIEKLYDSEFVSAKVYHSWWFVTLWILFCLASCIYIILQKLYRQKAVFLLHCAFVVILLGAFITYISAERGYIHLRQGKPQNAYILDDDITKRSLPFEIKLVLFEMEYHPDSDQPADFISYLMIDGEMCKVSMNKIKTHQNYRFYQIDYDRDEMGSVLLVNYDPFGIATTYTGYLLLALSILWLLWLRIGWKGLVCIVIPTIIVWFYISRINPMTPVLRTPMLAMHVSVIVISYLLLLQIAIMSLIGIISKKRCKQMYRWNKKLLYPALFLLAAGIFIGAVWANISWGRYWGWDAKETWALITMLVYAIPMHRKSLPFFSDPLKFHRYCLIAFLTVLMTFLGVSFLLRGLHSYI